MIIWLMQCNLFKKVLFGFKVGIRVINSVALMHWILMIFAINVLLTLSEAVFSYEPQISYFDGTSYVDSCLSKLERRVSAMSGLLISHQQYGITPYNASKNCFLLITAPAGYRIRLRVLDFNVLGDTHNCDKDTLHIFDHEKAIDAERLRDASTQEDTSPGPILGQFCGIIRNASELAVSTENALTLWWHTDAELPLNHKGVGFRLLWSAFRKSNTAPCNSQREFTCKNQECIPAELACNRYPDCKDESDLIRALQIVHKCDFVEDDVLGSLTGFKLLLICMASVSFTACLCICVCVCCKCTKVSRKTDEPIERLTSYLAHDDQLQQPTPPGFYPPTPPKEALLKNSFSIAERCTTHRELNSDELNPSVNVYEGAQQSKWYKKQHVTSVLSTKNQLERAVEQANNGEYSYVRNGSNHLLI